MVGTDRLIISENTPYITLTQRPRYFKGTKSRKRKIGTTKGH